MHELAVGEHIVAHALAAARAHRAKRVKTLRIALGPDDHVTADALAFSIQAASDGTEAEGAAVQIRRAFRGGVVLEDIEIEEAA